MFGDVMLTSNFISLRTIHDMSRSCLALDMKHFEMSHESILHVEHASEDFGIIALDIWCREWLSNGQRLCTVLGARTGLHLCLWFGGHVTVCDVISLSAFCKYVESSCPARRTFMSTPIPFTSSNPT